MAHLLACCVTLGKRSAPAPQPDLLASERGGLDHAVSELGAKPHGQLLAATTLVGRAVGKGRMCAGCCRRTQTEPRGLGRGRGRGSKGVCVCAGEGRRGRRENAEELLD